LRPAGSAERRRGEPRGEKKKKEGKRGEEFELIRPVYQDLPRQIKLLPGEREISKIERRERGKRRQSCRCRCGALIITRLSSGEKERKRGKGRRKKDAARLISSVSPADSRIRRFERTGERGEREEEKEGER